MADLPDAAVQLTDDEYMHLDFGDGAEELLQTAAQGRTPPHENNMVSNFVSCFILVLFQGMYVAVIRFLFHVFQFLANWIYTTKLAVFH